MSGGSAVESGEAAGVLDAAMKNAGVVWLLPDQPGTGGEPFPPTTGPVWHVWAEGACYLLTGPGEQVLPGVIPGRQCDVIARNACGGRSLTWTASVEAVDPTDPRWAVVAPKLAAARLNGGDPVEMVPTWPGRLTIIALRPSGAPITHESGLPDGSQAAPPLHRSISASRSTR